MAIADIMEIQKDTYEENTQLDQEHFIAWMTENNIDQVQFLKEVHTIIDRTDHRKIHMVFRTNNALGNQNIEKILDSIAGMFNSPAEIYPHTNWEMALGTMVHKRILIMRGQTEQFHLQYAMKSLLVGKPLKVETQSGEDGILKDLPVFIHGNYNSRRMYKKEKSYGYQYEVDGPNLPARS